MALGGREFSQTFVFLNEKKKKKQKSQMNSIISHSIVLEEVASL
jgi:hypothetical protein